MGKVAGAVLTAAAPEARIASGAAGRRRPSPADPRVTAPGSKAAKQRADIEALKASRPPEPGPPAPAVDGPPPTPPGGGPSLPSLPSLPAPVQTGSGVLLGVFAWAVGLAYLRNGSTGVKQFFQAKFFNQVTTNAQTVSAAAAAAAKWKATA